MRRSAADIAASRRKITRRGVVLGGLQLGVVGVLGWRMRQMQVEQADEFRLLAEENRVNIRLIPPARGAIFDRAGTVLAENEQNLSVVMVREDAGDVAEVLSRLQRLIPLSDEEVAEATENMMARSPFVPVGIKDRLTWDDLAKVAANAPALPGIQTEVGLSRLYPEGSDTGHVVGYVGPVSDFDLSRIDDQDPLLQIPRFQIGKTGVENKLERLLRGAAGTKRIEVNARGRVMRELSREEGDPGADLQLTIDSRLQSYVQARLDGESASVVVMDVATGDLLCVASAPSFDPNLFVRGISVPDWRGLNEDIYRPLSPKAVAGAYPPGSTFKMLVALAAMEAGVIGPEDTVRCNGSIEVSGIRFHCWRRGGHGNMNYHESLKQSCDVYYYELAQRAGIDRISAMAARFGLGERFDIPMSAVSRGINASREWKQTERGEAWRIGDSVNASIGQGYQLSSPLQLAVMTARLATGRAVSPRLVRAIDGVAQPSGDGAPLGVNENLMRRVRQSMYDVSNHRRGTAYRSRIVDDALKMAGKTGTSQVRRITPEERARGVIRNEDLPWERRDHALWVNYAPWDDPRIAVSVIVEHGGGGSSAAAPIGRDVTLAALSPDARPDIDAYPSGQRDAARLRLARVDEIRAARSVTAPSADEA
ncbi:MAG: penicillin-binding protein 2 [Paracoccaceae bacterium]